MTEQVFHVPDIGAKALVIELHANPGSNIELDQPLATVESDKATFDIPAPASGTIKQLYIKTGLEIQEGDKLITIDTASNLQTHEEAQSSSSSDDTPKEQTESAHKYQDKQDEKQQTIYLPDTGSSAVTIAEICVKTGSNVNKDDSLLVVESDKATIDIPSPYNGTIQDCLVTIGQKLNPNAALFNILSTDATDSKKDETQQTDQSETKATNSTEQVKQTNNKIDDQTTHTETSNQTTTTLLHAGPGARLLAREMGIDLAQVNPTGPKNRILKEDIKRFVKTQLENRGTQPTKAQKPEIDFSQWGHIEKQPLSRLRKIAADNFQDSWSTIPHVTQFDEANITELESFRKLHKTIGLKDKNLNLTILPFIIKACTYTLKQLPQFCASLSADQSQLIYKKYVNIGIAVDTPAGLLVPVVKDADQKSIWELTAECSDLADKARNKKLKPQDMQGGCFTISSLGAIGGTAFTPIINPPEVAILGISKATIKPLWNGSEFKPELCLPLSLSYDHRVINGVDAALFTKTLCDCLQDLRTIIM